MKKNIIVIILFVISGKMSFAQNIFPLNNPHWFNILSMTWKTGPSLPPQTNYYYEHYIIEGDTIVNNRKFYKLFISKNEGYNIFDFKFFTYIYIENSKVYYGKTDSLQLLLDFDMKIGDKFKFKSLNSPNPTIIELPVINVDSLVVNNSYRKRIKFQDFSEHKGVTWVSGIGDIEYGLIFDYGFINTGSSFNSFLSCFSENGLNLYGTCEPTGINSNLIDEQNNLFFPNPAHDKIVLISTNFVTIELIDINGRIIRKLACNSNEIKLDFVKPGMYVIRFINDERTITKKLIIY